MTVIGIDFGDQNCVVAGIRNDLLEVLISDYNERITPSYVAFADNHREFGEAARFQHVTNVQNTIYNFKQLLGQNFQYEGNYCLYKIVRDVEDGSIKIDVNYNNKRILLKPEQIAAMLLSKLKNDANNDLKNSITGCVIAVPSYFNEAQRKSILVAAGVASLNCNRLLNESTAVAINYAFNRKLPSADAKPRNVIFVDFGHNAMQISACAFNVNKIEVIAFTSDLIGGRNIDELLADHFISEINQRDKNRENKTFYVELIYEVEKLKKKMSVTANEIKLNLQVVVKDKNEIFFMQRSQMEEICQSLFERAEELMITFLKDSRWKISDIDAVEIIGGSSRIPAIKSLIEKVFHKRPSSTMNQDEAVARGCAIFPELLKKQKNFIIKELYNSPKSMKYCPFDEANLKIQQIHSNYKSESEEFLNISLKEFCHFRVVENNFCSEDQLENNRRLARNKLEEFLFLLKNNIENDADFRDINKSQRNAIESHLSSIKKWTDGSEEQYKQELEKLNDEFGNLRAKYSRKRASSSSSLRQKINCDGSKYSDDTRSFKSESNFKSVKSDILISNKNVAKWLKVNKKIDFLSRWNDADRIFCELIENLITFFETKFPKINMTQPEMTVIEEHIQRTLRRTDESKKITINNELFADYQRLFNCTNCVQCRF